jgi:hypothetical protein
MADKKGAGSTKNFSKIGYPYSYGDNKTDGLTKTDAIKVYKSTIVIAVISVFLMNPVMATEVTASAVSGNGKNRTATAIALLATIDTATCGKASACVKSAAETIKGKSVKSAKSNPKLATAIVCTAAIAWCARGVAERIINHHL